MCFNSLQLWFLLILKLISGYFYVCLCDGYQVILCCFHFYLIASDFGHIHFCWVFWLKWIVYLCLFHNFFHCWLYQFLRVLCIERNSLWEYSSTNIFPDILIAINFVLVPFTIPICVCIYNGQICLSFIL